jgi:MFS family permease
MRKRWLFLAPAALLGMLLFIAIGGFIVELLWNWLLPPLFGWREITFWQAIGLLALCRILFGGSGRNGLARSRVRRRMRERWEAMTPEERERVRERIRARCGFSPSASESHGQRA